MNWKKETGKAMKCTRAFSAVIIVAMVFGGFTGFVSTDIGSMSAKAETQTVYGYSLNSNLPDTSWQFSFVHLTDLHIGAGFGDFGAHGYWDSSPPAEGSDGAAAQNLRDAVNWINYYKDTYHIKFVIITGDITDSGERSEFMKAYEILEGLTIPYIPVIGNHDIWPYTDDTECYGPYGDRYFREVFAPQFEELKTQLPRWDDGTRNTLTWNPDADTLGGDDAGYYSYFQNFAFDYAGYHFMCVDLNTRDHATTDFWPFKDRGANPYADLAGGSWDWFKDHYNNYPYKAADNILIFAHQPLTKDLIQGCVFSFNYADYNTVTSFLNGNYHKYYTGLWCAGHIHRNHVYNVKTWGLSTVCPGVETGCLKDGGTLEDGNTFRVMFVYGKTSIPEPYGVILYEHINYQGRGEFFPSQYPSDYGRDPDLRNNVVGNDVASSHRLYKPYTYVWLYRDINYGGGYKFFYYDVSDYRSYGINDWASSIIVW